MVKQAIKEFFGTKRLYFVCGKVYEDMHFANRIVHWFAQHELPVIPVNPKGGSVDLTVDSISNRFAKEKELPIEPTIAEGLSHFKKKSQLDGISIAFVTPPTVTLSILQELQQSESPVVSVWFQPGSWNVECINYATQELHIPEERVINDCILINGHNNYTRSELL